MSNINQDYVGWWILIPAVLLAILPVKSCVETETLERTKRVQIMSKHCSEQGKTFKAEKTEASEGLCI